MTHRSSTIAIKMADVDEKMQSVIIWLNQYESVITYFCCQGGMIHGNNTEPYVLFSCHETSDLISVCKVINMYPHVHCETEWYSEMLPIRYKLVFRNPKTLKKFKEGLLYILPKQ